MREHIICYINGKRHQIGADQAFLTVSDYLRYESGLTGTKVVCAEGDCAACTILVSRCVDGDMTPFQSINSCISFMYLLDKCQIITVEGLVQDNELHEAQQKMKECHGSQCGYCTPGFVCSMAFMADDLKANGKDKTEQKIKNYLTGNLCRCTGYEPIIKAGKEMNLNRIKPLNEFYATDEIGRELGDLMSSVHIKKTPQEAYLPASLDEALDLKHGQMKMTSGATDLGVQYNKGRYTPKEILSLNNIAEAYSIEHTDSTIEIGAKASLSMVEQACGKDFPEFSRMLNIFAAPGIKNNGTLVGNLVNASPIADTIPFLLVNEAKLEIRSKTSTRVVRVNDFFLGGYKELDLKPDELVSKVILNKSQHEYVLYKVSLRRDLDISAVTFGARYQYDKGVFSDLKLAFGGVGPVVIETDKLSSDIVSRGFDFDKNFETLLKEISPMSDIRGSREFRNQIACNLLCKFHDEVLGHSQEVSI